MDWTDKLLIKFNSEKCKVMHIGKTNPKWTYTITHGSEVQELQETKLEKDLGILLSNDQKYSHQVDSVKNKANKVIGRTCVHIFRFPFYKETLHIISKTPFGIRQYDLEPNFKKRY